MTQMRALHHQATWKPRSAEPVRPPLPRRVRDAVASAGIRRPRFMRGPRTEQPFDAPVIQTSRLTLRPHRMSDADDWFALQSDPAVTRFLPWPERDRSLSARHLRDRTRHTRLWQQNDFLALAVEKEGRLIGDVSLHLRSVPADERSVEIGWVMHPGEGGHGYATEATAALLDFAFAVVRARQVVAVTDRRNIPSVALARRLGFTRTLSPQPGAGPTDAAYVLTRLHATAADAMTPGRVSRHG